MPNGRKGATSLRVSCGLLHNLTGGFPPPKPCRQRACCWLLIFLEKGPGTRPQSVQCRDRVSWLAKEAGFLFLTVSRDWVALSAWNFADLFAWPSPPVFSGLSDLPRFLAIISVPEVTSPYSCLWRVVTSLSELRQGHGEEPVPRQCLKAVLTSGKAGQATDIFIFYFPLNLVLGIFMFCIQITWREKKRKEKSVCSRTASQDALEGKFPFWVCCLKEFPRQADVNS